MLKLIFNCVNIFLAGFAMVLFDEDPTKVSLMEWSMLAIILLSGYSLLTILLQYLKDSGEL
jgi:hypothetical protein